MKIAYPKKTVNHNFSKGRLKLKAELKKFLLNNQGKIAQKIAMTKLEEIEESLIEETAAKNVKIVKDHLANMESMEGTFSNLLRKDETFPVTTG